MAPDLRIGTALITLGAMDDLAEWAFLIGFSLVLATGIGCQDVDADVATDLTRY